ncbi:MAG TPA: hypothetical protein VLK65_05420 [Vicinamibacteria bacterium]|nr:hypothetical protein [Vicinamibacteria bacterium]
MSEEIPICDGSALPRVDPDRIYALRTNGLLGWEILDVTDPGSRPRSE